MSQGQETINVTGADNASRITPAQSPPPTQKVEDSVKPEDSKPAPALKLFTLSDVKRVVEVPVTWPSMYPGFLPWEFEFRLALSKEVDKARQTFLGLPEEEARDQKRYRALILDQVCDLLVRLPTGFGDLQDNGQAPGVVFRQFVEGITDPDQQETVYRITFAANNGYWNRCSPQSFSQ